MITYTISPGPGAYYTVYSVDTPTGGTEIYEHYIPDTETGPYEPNVALNNYHEDLIMLQIIRNSYVRPIPRRVWNLTPAKSITIRPEMRIKQPVSRAGYRRGNRVWRNIKNMNFVSQLAASNWQKKNLSNVVQFINAFTQPVNFTDGLKIMGIKS